MRIKESAKTNMNFKEGFSFVMLLRMRQGPKERRHSAIDKEVGRTAATESFNGFWLQ